MATLTLAGTSLSLFHARTALPAERGHRARPRLVTRSSAARDVEPGRGSVGPSRRTGKAEALPACAPQASVVHHSTLEDQRQRVEGLVGRLHAAPTYGEKLEIVMGSDETQDFLRNTREGATVERHLALLGVRDAYLLLVLVPLGQRHVLTTIPTGLALNDAFAKLLASLAGVERAYDAIGGLAGYQLQCLRLLTAEARAGGAAAEGTTRTTLHVPRGLRLNGSRAADRRAAAAAVAAGVAGVPSLAEVWPLGGCGDRLGLACEETGEGLPAAVLQYAGRSLLESLVRDTLAREHLHWRLHGGAPRPTTPVAIMTSAAKGNAWRVEALCEARGWWGRGRDAFRLFSQPLVPVLSAADARWLLPAPLAPLMKPGGHGVIWKLMLDEGVYDWLRGRGRAAAVLRQISNPLAGTDDTALALAGRGLARGKAFGFASCERVVGAAEGVNVLARFADEGGDGSDAAPPPRYAVTNVEYTEFGARGLVEQACGSGSGHSAYPANANILYADLRAVEGAVRAGAADGDAAALLPGLLLNTGKRVTVRDAAAGGATTTLAAGRLECTMQNLADCFAAPLGAACGGGAGPDHAADHHAADDHAADDPEADDGLPTFLVTNVRRKVTSSAKRAAAPGSTAIHQTPVGSFYDLQLNAAELLGRCGFDVPQVGTVPEYLASGPGLIFLYHPALGPLWSVVAQKLRGGRLAPRAELQLEVAEADVQGLDLEGSLLVLADDVLGHMETPGAGAAAATPPLDPLQPGGAPLHAAPLPDRLPRLPQPCDGEAEVGGACAENPDRHPRLTFSSRCGRLRLRDLAVRNAGVDYADPSNVYWRHAVARHAACRVHLHGHAELDAAGVTLVGDLDFHVPDGHRLTLRPDASPRGWSAVLEPIAAPSWNWRYALGEDGTGVVLSLEEAPARWCGSGGHA
uniref:UGP3-like C-terminal hexapeptide repeats domain-containing protein n=1 Tax=Auxenochlorella protothecoides TaxID=3075 RepID=A0A1D2AAQ5_AUXPR